ncbi:MAG TPA: MBL fold metallo-hydrolase [Candidatus Limnocylindrales bacterium]|nr:MBL fold metallo-hydrolase [Candidatus Limnocylindrales bacterium]
MELTFLGGARTVTGSRHLVDTGRARVLVDCGMFQGSPDDTMRNRVPLGFDPRTLDAVVLTHAHLDHCGLLPLLVAGGFRGAIVCTAATAELARLVLLDSAKLQIEFAKRATRRDRKHPERAEEEDVRDERLFDDLVRLAAEGAEAPGGPDPEELLRAAGPEVEIELDGPLYTEDEVNLTLSLLRPIPYDQPYEAAHGVHVTLLDAGHILGSALVHMRLARAGGGRDTVIVFSGDLGRPGTPILRDPTPVDQADFVVCESTYGGREHQAGDAAIDALADVVNDAVRRKGVLLIPSFAIGRTQEIVWQLDRLLATGRIPQIPLFLDSPMARGASDIYRAHPEAYDEETAALLAAHEEPLDFPGQRVVQRVEESRAIARSAPPYVIVASNGMLTGGRSVGHAERLLGDPSATVLFVGYQGEGTLGGHLVRGAETARIAGRAIHVKATVRSLDGFSAHADESELLGWLGAFTRGRRPGDRGVPRDVYLVHGDPPAQQALLPKVEALGFRTSVPAWLQTVSLD